MPGLKQSFIQEDTSVIKYRLVKQGTTALQVVAATADTDVLFGITDDSASSTAGEPVGVTVTGFAKLVIASATTKGAYITATTGGKGVATTTDKKKYVGILQETTTVSDQVAMVQLMPGTLSV